MDISATDAHTSLVEYVVMGGTFDPVHDGHLESAKSLVNAMGYTHIYLMPCGDAYHKQRVSSVHHRVAMLKLAINDEPTLQLDDRETLRDGATYTVETLQTLREELGDNAHLCWVLGSDAAEKLNTWRDWQRVFELANLIVIHRAGEGLSSEVTQTWPGQECQDIKTFKQRASGCFMQLALEPVVVSSTEIRQALYKQEPVGSHVPQTVINYIELHGLYRGEN